MKVNTTLLIAIVGVLWYLKTQKGDFNIARSADCFSRKDHLGSPCSDSLYKRYALAAEHWAYEFGEQMKSGAWDNDDRDAATGDSLLNSLRRIVGNVIDECGGCNDE